MLLAHKKDKLSKTGIALWLQAPCRRTISVNDFSYKLERYFLSFPYVIFRIQYRIGSTGEFNLIEMRCGFMTVMKPKRNSPVYIPPLGNITSGRLSVCLSEDFYAKDLDELIESVVTNFWSSDFDLNEMTEIGYTEYDNNGLGNYPEWERLTRADSNWVPKKRHLISGMNYQAFSGIMKKRKKK